MVGRLRAVVPLLLAAATAVLPAAPSAPTPGADSVTIGIRPDGADRTRFEPIIDPGDTYSDAVELVNGGAEPFTAIVFASDAVLTESGAFGLQAPGSAPVDGGSWVGFGEGAAERSITVDVPAGRGLSVPFHVSVPDHATPGDHPAAIVARVLGADDEGAIVTQHRVAVRLLTHVTGELAPRVELAEPDVTYTATDLLSGHVTASAALANTGNVGLRASCVVVVSGLFGLWRTTTALPRTDLILPGTEVPVSAELTGVPSIGLLAVELQVRTAVDADAPDPGPLPGPTAVTTIFGPPWAILLPALLLAIAVTSTLLSRKHARARFRRRVDVEVAARLASMSRDERFADIER